MAAASGPPLRITVLGGGNGLSAVLRGLAARARAGEPLTLTAVVATADNGGSSGRLRRERGCLPPGDLRNCLVALSPPESSLTRLFAHRYAGNGALAGHSVGNLLLSALAEQEGCFLQGVERAGKLLDASGRVVPVSLQDLQLHGVARDGSAIQGETAIGSAPCAMDRVWLEPRDPTPAPGVTQAIRDADVIVLGPGSLYTSLLPVLLVPGVTRAMRESRGRSVHVANLMTQPGETLGMSLVEHLEAVDRHVGPGLLDEVLVHEAPLDPQRVTVYRERGSEPVATAMPPDRGERRIAASLVNREGKIRHDPDRLCRALIGHHGRTREHPSTHVDPHVAAVPPQRGHG